MRLLRSGQLIPRSPRSLKKPSQKQIRDSPVRIQLQASKTILNQVRNQPLARAPVAWPRSLAWIQLACAAAAREDASSKKMCERRQTISELFPCRITSINCEGAAGYECGLVTRQKERRGGDFGRLRKPFHRVRRDHLFEVFLRVGVLPQPCFDKGRLHAAGADAIDPDASDAMV